MLIHVAVGVVFNCSGELLIALRSSSQHQGGLWEFPGGKIEPSENVQTALARELLEEVNIVVIESVPLLKISHDYGDKQVLLDVWRVDKFSGQAEGIEGQEIKWVKPNELIQYEFPEANKQIIESLL